MTDIRQWKRVRVAHWTSNRGVMVTHVSKKNLDGEVKHQMLESLIGITVPAKAEGVVVFPLEFQAGTKGASYRPWVKADPTKGYFIVDPDDLIELGDAYDSERDSVMKGVLEFSLRKVTRTQDQEFLKRYSDEMLRLGHDRMALLHMRVDREKQERGRKIRKYRRRK